MASHNDDIPEQGVLDLLLPKACEALVLVTQCLVSAMLEFEEGHIKEKSSSSTHPRRRVTTWSRHGSMRHQAVRITPGATDPTGFSYVKRDLVRLLGVLCHKDRKIQDSIRNCEGITVVMNMCVVDERNPYSSELMQWLDLREHAIFTLHNLLEDNEENQSAVNNIQPSERWDQDGML
ncbi:hypothetical protein JVU11DRAFT_6359 [Chiua virens]|nr:hypothetical protein JVU11DRAFT_6359 [Chiua virens]